MHVNYCTVSMSFESESVNAKGLSCCQLAHLLYFPFALKYSPAQQASEYKHQNEEQWMRAMRLSLT